MGTSASVADSISKEQAEKISGRLWNEEVWNKATEGLNKISAQEWSKLVEKEAERIMASRRGKLSDLVSERDRLEEAYRVAAMAELGMEEELAMANIKKARSAHQDVPKLHEIYGASEIVRFYEGEIKQDEGHTSAEIVERDLNGKKQFLMADIMRRARLQRAYPAGTSELIIARDKCEDDYISKAVNEYGFTKEQADAKVAHARVKPHTAKMLSAIYDAHRKIEEQAERIVASRQRKLSKLVSKRDRLEEAYRVAAMEELGMEEALVMANIEKARSATRGVNTLDDIFEANRALRCCEDEIKQDKGDTPAKIVIRSGQPKITYMRKRMAFARLQRAYPAGTSELIIARDKCEDDYISKAVNEYGFTNEQADAKVAHARFKPHTAKMLNAIYDVVRKIKAQREKFDANTAQRIKPTICGGIGTPSAKQSASKEIQELIDADGIRTAVEKSKNDGAPFSQWVAVSYTVRTQVVAGTNYFYEVVVDVGGGRRGNASIRQYDKMGDLQPPILTDFEFLNFHQ